MASLSGLRSGTTLVLLHGLASNATRWWHFAAHAQLPGLKLLRPTLRGGAGSSDRGRIDMRVWCDDLVRLLDAENCERAVVGGHCLGANIALHFASRHPGRTAGLVLIEPMPPQALAGSMRRIRFFRRPILALAAVVRALNALGVPVWVAELDPDTAQAARQVFPAQPGTQRQRPQAFEFGIREARTTLRLDRSIDLLLEGLDVEVRSFDAETSHGDPVRWAPRTAGRYRTGSQARRRSP